MKNIFALLLKFISSITPEKKAPQPTCAFCGEKGHVEDDCPKAAKFKMFGEREG